MAAVAPGWFRLKLGRPLTDEETDALYALAGPLYQPWGRAVVVHENAAWMTERFLTERGVPFRYAHKAATPAPLARLPELDGLRPWVLDGFITPYQKALILQYGNRDGVFAIMPTGCLSGDAQLLVTRGLPEHRGGGAESKPIRLVDLVTKFNGGGVPSGCSVSKWRPGVPTFTQSVDAEGYVRLNRILAAACTGVRLTFHVVTADGRALRATADHRFRTADGVYVPLRDLRVGDTISTIVPPVVRGEARAIKTRRHIYGVVNHPFAYPRPRGTPAYDEHRLVAEATLNGMSLHSFLSRLRDGATEGLMFLDPRTSYVHHKNGDHTDNRPANLEVMPAAEHARLHGREGAWKHVAWRESATRVERIEPRGEEPTYDLTMESPHNNYVANGLVVHNSGKTLCGIVYGLLRPGPILFVTRAGARRTIATDIRRYTEHEPYIIESTGAQDIPPGTRFIVVGWESLVHHVATILRAGPVTAIFDESHLAKSHKRYEAVIERNEVTQEPVVEADENGGVKEKIKYRKLKNRFAAAEEVSRSVQWRMNLTATPIRDRIRDLWAQLDLLHPKAWGGFYRWARRYADAHPSQWGGIDTRGRSAEHLVNELMARMSFSTYYVPHSVTHRELPAKRRQVTYIRPDELVTGRDVMKEMREHGFRSASGEAWAKLALAAAMKRRRIVEEATAGAYKAPDGREGGKVVVLTGLRADVERIAAELRKPSTWGFGRGGAKEPPQVWTAHGGDTPQERDVIREAYMAHPGPCILVGTSDSLGESINLHDTDLAIVAMLPFTPGQVRQVEGRFSRLGQRRPVLLLYLIAEGTYDEHVAASLLSKLPAVEKIAQDEVIADFGKDLKGNEDEIAASLLAKLTAAEIEDDDAAEEEAAEA